MTAFEYGFVTKCAEYGIDPSALIKFAGPRPAERAQIQRISSNPNTQSAITVNNHNPRNTWLARRVIDFKNIWNRGIGRAVFTTDQNPAGREMWDKSHPRISYDSLNGNPAATQKPSTPTTPAAPATQPKPASPVKPSTNTQSVQNSPVPAGTGIPTKFTQGQRPTLSQEQASAAWKSNNRYYNNTQQPRKAAPDRLELAANQAAEYVANEQAKLRADIANRNFIAKNMSKVWDPVKKEYKTQLRTPYYTYTDNKIQ